MFGLFRRKTLSEREWRERRQAERLPVRIAAEIRLPSRRTLDCQTVNLSTHGAKLELPRSTILPATFEVRIPERRINRQAKLVWRGEDSIGVQFV
jgi:hypothetical protein